MISTEAVEAAAQEYQGRLADLGQPPWGGLLDAGRAMRSKLMRSAIEAAAPYLLREVWDVAYGLGWDAARGEPETPNPYGDIK
jgi:hypothetical protein